MNVFQVKKELDVDCGRGNVFEGDLKVVYGGEIGSWIRSEKELERR